MINTLLLFLIPFAWDVESIHEGFDYSQAGANWEGDCATGMRQSPININPDEVVGSNAALNPRGLGHQDGVIDTYGRRIQFNFTSGFAEARKVGQREFSTYELVQLHFHVPSEHTVNGIHYDSELHIVHRKSDTEFLVIGLFLDTQAPIDPQSQGFMSDFEWDKLEQNENIDVPIDIILS